MAPCQKATIWLAREDGCLVRLALDGGTTIKPDVFEGSVGARVLCTPLLKGFSLGDMPDQVEKNSNALLGATDREFPARLRACRCLAALRRLASFTS